MQGNEELKKRQMLSAQIDLSKFNKGDFIKATEEEKKQAEKDALKADYDAAVQKLTDSMNVALLTGDTAAQESIRADFADLQQAYKEAVENV